MSIKRAIKLLSLIRGMVKSDYEKASEIMGEMHGFPQKLGQHFTLYQGNGFDQYFQSLCTESNVEEIDINSILQDFGIEFDDYKIAAQASIGQVYRVSTGEGDLALKVKYPGIEKKIKSDLGMLGKLLWPTRFLPLKNSGLLPLVHNLKETLLQECDYSREAAYQQKLSRLFIGKGEIVVPDIITYNDKAIVSHWVQGKTLGETDDLDYEWFIDAYLHFVLESLKQLGIVHADPHPGNFIISGRPGNRQVAVLDFGSVVEFSAVEQAAVGRLFLGEYDNVNQLADDLQQLGFSWEDLELYRPIIGDLVSILLEPFYYPEEYDFSGWRLQYKMNTLLASRAWERPLAIPLKPLLLFRTLQGLYYYSRKSGVSYNWHRAVKKLLG